MRKVILILLIIFISVGIAFSQDMGSDKSGYYKFFKEIIGQEIIVHVASADVTIGGVLLDVFEDGIIVESRFNKIYIPIIYIAYAKIKVEEKK